MDEAEDNTKSSLLAIYDEFAELMAEYVVFADAISTFNGGMCTWLLQMELLDLLICLRTYRLLLLLCSLHAFSMLFVPDLE